MRGLTQAHWRIQHFRSRACPTTTETVRQATGLPGRHLDAWLMPPEVCRRVFARGCCGVDLALVEGSLEDGSTRLNREHYARPGSLRPLSASLDLPTIALISCTRWADLHLDGFSTSADAFLIDGLEDPEDFPRIASAVKMMTKKPVIGAVEALPLARRALAEIPGNGPVDPDLIDALSRSFLRFADLPALKHLAHSRSFPIDPCEPRPADFSRFRVAYAQDEAFGGYFPDTLEMLEALGADLVEFSPLRSENLPDSVDLVMIGCGFADQYADALAANVSLTSALRSHVYCGRRIYSEGGGTAYLGRSMRIEGRDVPGVGILPLEAELRGLEPAFEPVSCELNRDTWLAPKGSVVRGYHSNRWVVRPSTELCHAAAGFGSLSDVGDFFYHHHAVGSLVHLHLAALPQVVAAFVGPHQPSLTLRQSGR